MQLPYELHYCPDNFQNYTFFFHISLSLSLYLYNIFTDPIEVYEQQQQSLVKDATNRTTPTAALPSISLRSSTSTPSSSHHPPASALRLSSRPLSEHLSSASASMAVAAASPRVRFNLEPMHFEFSDVDDISEDPTTSFKLRDRSPSDPLISLGETIDLRNRLNIYLPYL